MKQITPPRISANSALLLFFIALLITIVMCNVACNPVKKVLADPGKTEKVGREWEKKNPCVNDSVYVTKPGQIITEVLQFTDTVYATIYEEGQPVEIREVIKTKTITNKITDTIQVMVRDRRAEGICLDSVNYYKGREQFYKAQADEHQAATKSMKKERNGWRLKFWLLVAVAAIIIFRKPIGGLLKGRIPFIK